LTVPLIVKEFSLVNRFQYSKNNLKMGATSSIRPEIFSAAKDEYEIKKLEGLTDEQLFNHMKAFIDAKTEALDKPDASSDVIEDGNGKSAEETLPSTPMVAFTAPTETATEG
jgi:hypothetical protein